MVNESGSLGLTDSVPLAMEPLARPTANRVWAPPASCAGRLSVIGLTAPELSADFEPITFPPRESRCTSTVSPALKPAPQVETVEPGVPAAFARKDVPAFWLASTHPASDAEVVDGW